MGQRTPGGTQGAVAVLLSPRPAVVAAARRAGARTVVVAPDPSVSSGREGAQRQVRTDWRDHRRLVGAVAGLEEVRHGRAAVFGFDAAGALAAARANEELGLPGTPSAAVTALMDKAALRARSNTLHPRRPVSFARCGRAETLPFIATLIGYPCVVKPRAGADGEGVRLVLDEAGARALAGCYPEVTDLLVEEYLEGPELGVASLSRAGRHHILGWTRRRAGPGLTATGHDLPVALSPATAQDVRALVRDVLDLAGHHDGPSHTEVVLTAHGPRLIEAHARPGAEEIGRLLRTALGTDVLALALAAGLGLPGPARHPRTAHAGLRYVDFPPGCRLDGVHPGLAAARAVPGVVRVQLQIPPGATVRRAPTGALHHAYVLAAAATPGSLSRALDRAAGLLHQARPARRIPQPEGGLA
ncbi:ATP-grasp domain-containing protein [Streptomyces sp. CB00455]|uniref:ATP-grasp domain-containing protein n=1 Tax=Streptomyces sp. CB00455 TaxID=1703927 RepID=UPI00093FD235|nr:ATP-grasp domain-containing protein [Streptomyces sp. CB00455]